MPAIFTEPFLERGYDGVSVDDVMREVGGSKTNVYSFYGGKDRPFFAVRDAILRDGSACCRNYAERNSNDCHYFCHPIHLGFPIKRQ